MTRWRAVLLGIAILAGVCLGIFHHKLRNHGDDIRAEASRALDRAEQLRRERTAESLALALDAYRQARDRFQQAGDGLLQARALRGLSKTRIARGEPRQALRHAEQALDLYQSYGDNGERAAATKELASVYRRLGEPVRALDLFEQAIAMAESVDDDAELASTLNNLGVLHASLGEKQAALGAYDRALGLWRRLGNRKRQNTTWHNLGELYVSLGRFEEGLEFLHQASEGYQQVGDFGRQAVTLTAVGWAYSLQEQFEDALKYYDEALSLQKEAGDRQAEALTLDQIGTVYRRLGQYDEALEAYNLALQRVEGNRLDEAYTRLHLGATHLAAGRPAAAEEPLLKSLEIFRALGALTGEAEALTAVATLERQRKRLGDARVRLQQALDIIESVRGRLLARGLRASYTAVQRDVTDSLIDLLMQLEIDIPGQGHGAEAFEASERARARTWSEAVAEAQAGARSVAAPKHLDRERSLRARINLEEVRRITLLESGLKEEAASAERMLYALLLEYEKVQGEIGAAVGRPWHRLVPWGLQHIQQEILDDDTLLLAYELGRDRSFLWVAGRDFLKSFVLPPQAEIEELASRAHQLMPRLHLPGYRQQASATLEELSEVVLGPARDRLQGQRLLILASGALHYVPFSALWKPPVSDDDPRWLVADHEIVYLPSLSLLGLLDKQQHPKASALLAVVADPVFHADDSRLDVQILNEHHFLSGGAAEIRALERSAQDFGRRFARLPFAGMEAEAILALTPGADTRRATGLEASRALVLSGELDRYRILHFATHGLLNTAHPDLSGIVLSLVDASGRPQEGLLRVHDLYELRLSADLVVLSGCRTALGKRLRGEGLLGLTRGFFYAGARRLVVSFWNVDDRATAELMERFYIAMLRDRQPPAKALRAAQLSMLAEVEWQAPYYWAGFALHGDWR